ncbi:MAG: gliding motility-associated C-terminal domain-containing protein [Flavobacteriales bacterium]|nr:gliding motility-associated C-terminal domain-containing protein [Flavobacteriales bacterium]
MRWAHILVLLLWSVASFAQEICDNGIDDDGNGLIDLNDPACPCSPLLMAEGRPSFIRNHSFEERTCCPFGPVITTPYLNCAVGWQQATSATSDYLHTCGFAPAGTPMPPPDGEGAVAFQVVPGLPWQEYVGTCLTYPPPANILYAGTTYTLSLWIAGAASDNQIAQAFDEARPESLFPDPLPLALFGYANECQPFPIPTFDCVGYQPGWQELGRVLVQPAWDWVRVSITFTPSQNIHSVIIGSACEVPPSFAPTAIQTAQGWKTMYPYFLIDDLMLTEAGDQVLSPVTTSGAICEGNALAVAQPPAGATGYQWYHDGVALPGQTGPTLDVSANGRGGGLYTMASTYNGQCLMGAAHVPPPVMPMPLVMPSTGCAPLAVAFNAGGGFAEVGWDLGDGTTSTDYAFTHTYTVPGTFDVRLTVRNGAGCERDTLVENAVTVLPGVAGRITATPDPAPIEHPEVALSGAASVGDIVSWWWDLGVAAPSTSTDPSLNATFPAECGTYPVMLVVTTAAGCVDTVRSVVVVRSDVIEMPNVFSPNGDGHNDRFVPREYSGAPALLEVYNRWGQKIFSTRALEQGWPGSDAPDGTYYYIVTPDEPLAGPAGAKGGPLTGHVTLIR